MLLPPALAAAPRTRLLLTEAIRSTRGAPATSLWTVVEHLESGKDAHAHDIAAYLRDMAEMPLARLFFPTGPATEPVRDAAVLTVLTMAGLILPPPSVPREHWSTTEQMSVPLLHLASWYATRTIYGRPRAERKLVALDETHFLGEWGAGRALFTRLGRDSRKWNTCVLAASQNPADVLGMEVSNFISAAFIGRIEDEHVAADALRMLRVPPGVGYESVLAKLSPRSATTTRSGFREFVMRDVDGNVDRMRVDLDHLPQLLAVLDTTATPHAPSGRHAAAGPDRGRTRPNAGHDGSGGPDQVVRPDGKPTLDGWAGLEARAGLDETAGLDDDLAPADATVPPTARVGPDDTARPAGPARPAKPDDAAEPDDADVAEEKEHQNGRAPAVGVGWPDRLVPSGQKVNGAGHSGKPVSRS